MQRTLNRFLSAWGRVLLCAVLLASCSSTKLGYRFADTLLMQRLDTYFDLDPRQEQSTAEALRTLHRWHRQNELAEYAQFLAAAEQRLHASLGAEEVLSLHAGITQRLLRLGDRAAPDLARLAATLSDKQIDHFARELAQNNADLRREFAKFDGPRALDERVAAAIERAESWFGEVSTEQRAQIRSHLSARPSGHQWWLAERDRRQQDLLTFLRRQRTENLSVDQTSAWLRDYFARMALPADAERRAPVLDYRRRNAELIAELLRLASPTQKAHAAARLRAYANDFSELAHSATRG